MVQFEYQSLLGIGQRNKFYIGNISIRTQDFKNF